MTHKPINDLIKRADAIMDGSANALEDWRDAKELYQLAVNMGSNIALIKLGMICLHKKPTKRDKEKRRVQVASAPL